VILGLGDGILVWILSELLELLHGIFRFGFYVGIYH
jgi:hypothetical protein